MLARSRRSSCAVTAPRRVCMPEASCSQRGSANIDCLTCMVCSQRAEHNEGLVSTLEEVALHQQNIEKIEVLGQLCPNLKILYLQSNLISKIQNLHKLKVGAQQLLLNGLPSMWRPHHGTH